jgi:hypothetical protein
MDLVGKLLYFLMFSISCPACPTFSFTYDGLDVLKESIALVLTNLPAIRWHSQPVSKFPMHKFPPWIYCLWPSGYPSCYVGHSVLIFLSVGCRSLILFGLILIMKLLLALITLEKKTSCFIYPEHYKRRCEGSFPWHTQRSTCLRYLICYLLS